ncbi:hypothetical protein BSKO_08227 [Bryopsis sp. KO-2023]|nr:hypothetical protein BSKO_08227 [Bryopsis sp. KO-2023]
MARDKVKLVSSDGFEMVIDYKAACVSKTISNMLSADGVFTESESHEIELREISGPVLEEVCKYFYYHLHHQSSPRRSIPEFKVEPVLALDLLMAANFLDA